MACTLDKNHVAFIPGNNNCRCKEHNGTHLYIQTADKRLTACALEQRCVGQQDHTSAGSPNWLSAGPYNDSKTETLQGRDH
jgi:hypothetical protein